MERGQRNKILQRQPRCAVLGELAPGDGEPAKEEGELLAFLSSAISGFVVPVDQVMEGVNLLPESVGLVSVQKALNDRAHILLDSVPLQGGLAFLWPECADDAPQQRTNSWDIFEAGRDSGLRKLVDVDNAVQEECIRALIILVGRDHDEWLLVGCRVRHGHI